MLAGAGSMNCHSVIVRELRRMAKCRSTFHHRAIVCAWVILLLGGISVWLDWQMASATPGLLCLTPKGTVVFWVFGNSADVCLRRGRSWPHCGLFERGAARGDFEIAVSDSFVRIGF